MGPNSEAQDASGVIFLDCDDCLYQNGWATADKLTESIAAYTTRLGVSKAQAYALYKEHGTALRGLLAQGLLDAAGAERYLREVHDIDYSDIQEDAALDAILGRLKCDWPVWIFTASTAEHAQRCLQRLGLSSLRLSGIVDTRACKLETKHSPGSFEVAMAAAGDVKPHRCVLCDDSPKNVHAAKLAGWQTVLVGFHSRETGEKVVCKEADFHIGSLHGLPDVLPELFV
ncbi:unnamed protein product [Symbiodinium sp. CCMP2456]|nr:unnamed protein product [Symbiodinium sp. CCMP2456]